MKRSSTAYVSSGNFGLNGQQPVQEAYDNFLDGLFNNPERKAYRAEKRQIKNDKRQAEANYINSQAAALMSIANDDSDSDAPAEGGNMTMYVVVGVVGLIAVVGIAIAVAKSKKGGNGSPATSTGGAAEISAEELMV